MIATELILGEQRVLLQNISWDCFENLLSELGETRGTRLIYDGGLLEIMSPLMNHEHSNRLIERLIYILAEHLDLNLKSVGSMTCKRPDLTKAVEPDSSFYIENEPLVRSKTKIDLTQDPPPDLVIEVEYTNSAVNKLQLYAAISVPEIWRYNGEELFIYCLEGKEYIEQENSPTFASIPVKEIPRFIKQSQEIGEQKVSKDFRNWLKDLP